MKKNLLYLGLILVAAGIGVGLIAPSAIIPSLFPNPNVQGLAVGANSIGSLPLQLNASGLPILTFNSTAAVDFYLANASAYAAISGAASGGAGVRSTAVGLEGSGVYAIYENGTRGAFPFSYYPNTTAPTYLLNTTVLQPGTYYMMFYNRGSAAANLEVRSLSVSLSKIQSGEASVGTYVAVAAILFVAGIGLAIYAVVAKDTSKQQARIDADAAMEYEEMEKKSRRGSKR